MGGYNQQAVGRLSLSIAKVFKTPDHLIRYEVKFAVDEIPTIICEFEVRGDEEGLATKVEAIQKRFDISVKEI